MSNILIIKHGSLGDLIQANGAIKDIKNFYKNRKVFLLTAQPYAIFMSECPYLDGVIIDKRLPRWNLLYLNNLKKNLAKYNFTKIFDLQNSSRTKFYKRFILKNVEWSSTETSLELGQKKSDFDKEPVLERMEIQLKKSGIETQYVKNIEWSSSETTLEPGQKKSDFDKDPVLDRMEIQLKKSGIQTEFVKNVDLNWAISDISRLIKQYANNDYILLFPFCSKKLPQKKWPFFKDLISRLKQDYKNKYPILLAPGPDEIDEANELNAKVVLDNNQPINCLLYTSPSPRDNRTSRMPSSA